MSTTSLSHQLAVCSWSLQPESPKALAEALDVIGIRRTQIAMDAIRRGGAWSDGIARLDDLGITVTSAMFEAVGEDYSTLDTIRETGGIVPDATWPDTFAHFKQMVRMAEHAGLKHVTFHAGFMPHDPYDAAYKKLATRVAQVADLFADHGLTCCLETGQEEAPALSDFLRRLNKANVGVNFDPANLILYGKGDPIAGLRTLLPHVVSCHIKDALATTTPGTWGTEVVVGTGEVHWAEFFAILAGAKFPGTLAIEREAGDQRVADVQAAHRFVRPLLGH